MLLCSDFIYPLFIHEAESTEAIISMPGCSRHSLASMMREVEESMRFESPPLLGCVCAEQLLYHISYGLRSFILFPKISDNLKTNFGEESYNSQGLVPRAVRMIKERFPSAVVCTDVALDPYSSQVRGPPQRVMSTRLSISAAVGPRRSSVGWKDRE